MMAQPRVTKAWWMSSRISQRMRRRRNQCSNANAPAATRPVHPEAGAVFSASPGDDRVDLQPADLVAVALVVVAAVGVDPSGAAQPLAALAARGGGQAQSADVVRLPHQARRRWRITAWPQDHRAQYEAGYHLQVSELSREIPPEGPNSAKTPWRYWALPGIIGVFPGVIGVFAGIIGVFPCVTGVFPGAIRAYPYAQTLGRLGGAAQTS